MPLTPGQILNNRYRIVALLGRGGFGAVYRAWDLNLERPCAVKENLDTTAEAQKQFKREAQILAELSHMNLPHVYDHFILPGHGQYLVMDFVEGEDLQKTLESQGNQPLPVDLVMSWIGQVCDALIYLHSQNPPVIHRDIKPANIRITPDGKAMLVDFGISKVYDPNMKTTKGARAITHGYAPPEQYGTGRTDPQTDVYAIGATTYKLLTGKIPPASVDISTGNKPPPPPVDAENPTVTPGVSKAVAEAMQINRSDRTQSVKKYKTAIVLAGSMVTVAEPIQHVTPATTPTGTPTTQKNKIPTWLPWTGAVVILIVISLIIWNTLQGSDTSDSEQTQTALAMSARSTETLVPTSQSPSPTTTYTNSPEPTEQPSPTKATEPTDLSVQIVDDFGVPMMLVAAGAFMMGGNVDDALTECQKYQPDCQRSWYEDEEPPNEVYLDDFYIDVYEVTNSRYQECENAGVCSPPEDTHSYTHSHYYGNPEFGNYPVIYVSWHDAAAYCGWRGARLPTEAEWEKAARGGLDGKQYPWGDEDPVCGVGTEFGAKFDDDESCNETDTEPVGRYSANGYGIYDLAGNVREWVNSLFWPYPYQADDGREDINTSDARVLRDGAWFFKADNMRTAGRFHLDPGDSYSFIGFRCASTLSNGIEEAASKATPTETPTPTLSPTPELTPTSTSLSVQIVDNHGVPMVLVGSGEFMMGSERGFEDEKPLHSVYLDEFYIDLNEVTNRYYSECVAEGVCETPKDNSSGERSSYFSNPDFANYPVIWVSWFQALTYCDWRGARLVTEAEWEKAARGLIEKQFPWGEVDVSCTKANFKKCESDTTYVGRYPDGASPYGVFDLAGNVWEWTADWYGENYYGEHLLENPQGPTSGERRVIRGGSFASESKYLRTSNRHKRPPSHYSEFIGFRCGFSP